MVTLVLEKNKRVDCPCFDCPEFGVVARPKLGHHVLSKAKSKSMDMLVVPLCWKKRQC